MDRRLRLFLVVLSGLLARPAARAAAPARAACRGATRLMGPASAPGAVPYRLYPLSCTLLE